MRGILPTAKERVVRHLRPWVPALVWAAVIWFLSTDYFSSSATAIVFEPILARLFPWASLETLEQLHHLIRKAAHFIEYFVFGIFVYRGLRGERLGWRFRWAAVTLAIAICYAGLDEVHQAFTSDRTASAYDSLLDSAGAFVAQFVLWLRYRRSAPQPARESATSTLRD